MDELLRERKNKIGIRFFSGLALKQFSQYRGWKIQFRFFFKQKRELRVAFHAYCTMNDLGEIHSSLDLH